MTAPRTAIPPPNETIGGWAFDGDDSGRILGEGQSGTVFRVRNVRTGQLAAMKMHCGPCTSVGDETFLRELRIVAAQPVPGGMPAFYGSGRWRGVDYFVMELLEPFDTDRPGPALVADFLRVADILERLNDRYLHLDVKPGNLAARNGRPVLIDFSCAVTPDAGRTLAARVGTRRYRSPEAREGRPLTLQSDIYTTAAALHALLVDERDRRVYGPALRHATDNEPSARTASWAGFRRELLAAEADFRRAARAETRFARFATVVKRAALALAAILVAYGCIMYAAHRHRQSLLSEKFGDTINEQIRLRTGER